jgi:hypothetical protein
MIDNFIRIRGLLDFSDEDKFYFIQIYKRRKDNPEMKKDSRILDNFFISSELEFDSIESRIKEICIRNNARAYIRLNRRSFKQIALKTLGRIAKMIEDGNYRHANRAYLSCSGEFHKESNKTWVVDLDQNENLDVEFDDYVNQIVLDIQNLIFEAGGDDTMCSLPTKNGTHLICKPFNVLKFKKKHPEVQIQKDNPTILFVP